MPQIPWFRRASIVVPLAVGVVLRALHFAFSALRDPLFLHPVVDSWFHAHQAQEILADGWLLAGTHAFYKGPLYSYFLALLFSFFGAGSAVVMARLVSLALGSLAVAVIATIAHRLAGDRAAWAAGLAAAFYGTAIYFDLTLLLVPIVSAGLLLAAFFGIRSLESDSPERDLALAGAILGVVCLARANGVLVVVAVAGWAAMTARSGSWREMHRLRAAALIAVPALAIIAPVTLRNAVLERDPVLISWNGGINLYMGNDPAFDQGSGNWNPDLTWMRLYHAPAELGLERGSEHQRFFFRQTLLRAAHDPVALLSVLGEKVRYLVSAYEISNNRRIDEARDRSPVIRLLMAHGRSYAFPLSLIGPLLIGGLVVLRGRLRPQAALLLVMALAWLLAPLLFFNTARYRLSAIQLLLPLAAAGWVLFLRSDLAAHRRRLLLPASVVCVAAVVVTLTIPASATLPPSDWLNLSDVHRRMGDDAKALEFRVRAAEAEPENPFARLQLAEFLRGKKRFAEAIEHYERLLDTRGLATDWYHAALRGRARSLAGTARFADSAEAYTRLIDADPDRPTTNGREDFHLLGVPPLETCRAYYERGTVFVNLGRKAEAAADFAAVMRECPEAEAMVRRARLAITRMGKSAADPD